MSSTRWEQLERVFDEALEQTLELRPAWIARVCGDDLDLRTKVEALLRAHHAAGGFLETPAESNLVGTRIGPETILDEPAVAAGEFERPQALPERLGAYRVLRELGRGGMGVVYLGARDDQHFDKQVAIKVVFAEAVHPAVFQRFQAERRILAALDHPQIARLLDAGTSQSGLPYVVMEYVEGESIDVHCSTRNLALSERLRLFKQVCGAVQYAHEHLVVHRDIKARNILVTPDGTPKLLDFGIAKLLEPGGLESDRTRTAFRVLTLEIASPEQVRGEPVSVTTDVYSLGVLLYRLLTGRSPYRDGLTTDPELVRAICEEEPLRPSDAVAGRRDLRGDLDLITLKALRKDPARRYASVEQLAQDIQRYLDCLPVLAAPDAWTYRARKFIVRRWVSLGAVAAVTLALLLGGAATWWQARRAERRFNDVRKLAHNVMFDMHDSIAKLPGSTATRKLLVTQALEYLDGLALETGSDAALQRELASGYEKMADVLGEPNAPNLGDIEGALATYRKAQAVRERLLEKDPTNNDIRRDVSTTFRKLAYALYYTGQAREAIDEASRSSVIEEGLAATDKTPAQSLRLGASYSTHGFLLGAGGRTVESLDRLRKATSLFEALAASGWKHEEVPLQLSATYERLGTILAYGAPAPRAVPDLTAALEYYRKALVVLDSLAHASGSNKRSRRAIFIELTNLGDVSYRLGKRHDAVEYFRRALAEAENQAREDPADSQAQSDLALVCTGLGTTLALNGETTRAFRLLNRAAKALEPVSARDPANVSMRARVANNNIGLAHAHAASASNPALGREARLGHWREAKARYQDGYAFWAAMRDSGATTGSDAAQPDEIAREIAKCDAALGAAPSAADARKPK